MTGNDRTNFMTEYFNELPTELQDLIINKTYQIPKPKFCKGSIVRYTEERQTEMRKKLAQRQEAELQQLLASVAIYFV